MNHYRLKHIVLMEDEDKKEKMMEQHHKIGKSFKTELQQKEKELEEVEL
jgi:hypothetical protein